MVPVTGVLVLTPFFSPNIGGVETHLSDLTQKLSSLGYKVFVHTYSPLTTDSSYKNHEVKDNIEIFRYSWIGRNWFHRLEIFPFFDFLYLTPYLFIRTLLWLFQNRRQVNVIHAQGLNASLIGLALKRIFNLRLVTSIHAIYEIDPASITAHLNAFILNRNDHVLALSRASQKELITFGVDPQKISVFRYWIDLNIFKPQKVNRHSDFSILFVGRLIPKKGIRLMVKAAQKLPGCRFIFAGTGPDSQFLTKAASRHRNIVFLGPIPNNQLPSVYNSADIFCIPSLYQEGFGRVVMEAVACGLPVIGSNLGGIPEALSSDVSILSPPSTAAIVRSISKLKNNPSLFASLKGNCRSFATRNFSDKNITQIIRYYSL